MSAAVTPIAKTHLRLLTQSEIREFRACPRRHDYAYRKLRRPIGKGDALNFGILWHVGQEGWWGAGPDAGERLATGIAAMRAKPGETTEYARVTAEELLVGYTARWADAGLTTIAVEKAFRVPLVNPETGAPSRTFEIGGKLDVIANDDRDLVLVEHKSSNADIQQGSLYWTKTKLDTQVSVYLAGAKAAGFDVRRCVYDVVRKPTIRPLKATPEESRKYTKAGALYANQRLHDETPDEFRVRLRADILERPDHYFARGDVVRLDADERDHAFDIWQIARMMRDAELAGFAPKNPDACSQYGGCSYLSVCAGEASIDDDTLFRTAAGPHEELETE